VKVGFTGTRKGMSQHQKEQFALKLYELNPTEFHHGDCIGADAEAHDIVREFFPDVEIFCHPPKASSNRAWKKCDHYLDPLPYLVRDHEIVDDVEYMFGSPLQDYEILRSGTWAAIRYARKISRPITVLER
jgi:hypothetical protein